MTETALLSSSSFKASAKSMYCSLIKELNLFPRLNRTIASLLVISISSVEYLVMVDITLSLDSAQSMTNKKAKPEKKTVKKKNEKREPKNERNLTKYFYFF